MTTTPQELISQLRALSPALRAWGAYVVEQTTEMLTAEIGSEQSKVFFKLTPSFRVKDEASAIKKQEKKQYENPIEQMTDLVGARFVVLLRTDLEILQRVILSHSGWSVSRERHYEYEASDDPEVFDYQSIHFLVRTSSDFERESIHIPAGTACEVQIRTVLQHAYAELCHDRIYKSSGRIPPSAKRIVARCMALMETTDLMFCEAAKEIQQVSADRQHWIDSLTSEYRRINQAYTGDDGICLILVSTYLDLLDGVKITDVLTEASHPAIQARIAGRLNQTLFASPACILCYWLVIHHRSHALHFWPDESLRGDLSTICADLGVASCDT
jgi:putative GTP pyrophosphokinase